ncbi:hypothetical protein [Neptunicella sp. SCSIO 80796]|uniref:hypothetical protein n=1 Tax=Neptunicella plasticusilytica TaxID=3117012 RepID=UPI003A4D7F53
MRLIKSLNIKHFLMALVFMLPLSASAISLSTYRIYVDYDSRTASFMMFNKSAVTEECQLDLVHNDFDAVGNMTPHQGDQLPANSAEPWIRYSPRNFVVEARAPQTVRFTIRRQANSEPAEYRSYLRIFCDEKDKPQSTSTSSSSKTVKLSVKPRLVQNVPVIVRTGKLEATVSFGDISVNNEKLSFTINRQGNRSVYGTLELVNKQTGEVINYKKNVSVYTETNKSAYDFSLRGRSLQELALRFTEDQDYGGTITYQQDLTQN